MVIFDDFHIRFIIGYNSPKQRVYGAISLLKYLHFFVLILWLILTH